MDNVYMIHCKLCSQTIKNGLCKRLCDNDGVYAEHRNTETVEIKVYEYKETIPYTTRFGKH